METEQERKREGDFATERMHRSLFENHPDIVFRMSLEGRITEVNPAAERVTGYTAEELMSSGSPEGCRLLEQRDHLLLVEHFRAAVRGSCEDFEMLLLHREGSRLTLRTVLIPVTVEGQVVGIYGIAKDVTDYKRNTDKLKETQELYRLISENAGDIMTFIDPDGKILYVSPNVEKILGYSPDEVQNRSSRDLWHREDSAWLPTAAMLTNSDHGSFECRVRHKDGRYLWLETQLTVIRNASGEVEKIIGIGRDISERKRAELDLAEREEVYRRLVEDSPDAIAISVNRQWKYVNNSLVHLFGGESKEQLTSIPSYDFVHPDYVDMNRSRIGKVEMGGTAHLAEQVLLKLNGEPFYAETISIPTIYQGEPAIHTIIRDVTRKKEEQAHLIHSEKLNVAGQLAAGIAHEIRNPLTAVKGFIQLMRTQSKDQYFDIITSELIRMEEIITELLLLAKPGEAQPSKVEITHTVKQVVSLMEPQAHMRNIHIDAVYEGEPFLLDGDENQLKQAFINFLKNAIEAMPDGGTIEVRTAVVDSHIRITFRDQGVGIPADKLLKIGEPFYSTKEKGTGLGFMVSRKMIENHKGHLQIQSTVGVGTQIEITLPPSD